MEAEHTKNCVTGLILAGGAGRRVSARDKGLLNYRGAALVEHVTHRLRPQVSRLIISCNRNQSQYRAYADTVVTDLREHFQGPLAGIEAALPLLATELLLICPCDAPLLPEDLVQRLTKPLADSAGNAHDVCYAHDGERSQYLFAVCRRAYLATLPEFLEAGGRAVRDWFHSGRVQRVDFSDQREAFANFNTQNELNRGGSA